MNATSTLSNNTNSNVMYRGENKSSMPALVRAITTPDLLMFSSTCLIPSDENVSNQLVDRFLIADEDGDLYLLMLSKGRVTTTMSTSIVSKLTIERLGKTSPASAISYLDNSVVFIGSAYGDSQIIKLHTEQVNTTMSDSNELPSYVEVLEVYQSWSYRRLLRHGFRTSWSKVNLSRVQSAREDLSRYSEWNWNPGTGPDSTLRD